MTDTLVWSGGVGHRFLGNEGGDECFRCGAFVDDTVDSDPDLQRLVPDCYAERGGDHHWMPAMRGIECAYGDADVRRDSFRNTTLPCIRG